MKILKEFPKGEVIYGMCVYEGVLIVATTFGVFRLDNDEFVPIPFAEEMGRAKQETNTDVGTSAGHNERGDA